MVNIAFILVFVCIGLSSTLALAALIQRCSKRYRRLWWLALFGMSISAGLVILFVIEIVLVLLFMNF